MGVLVVAPRSAERGSLLIFFARPAIRIVGYISRFSEDELRVHLRRVNRTRCEEGKQPLSSRAGWSKRGMKLLVVEDNHSQASLLGRAFSERGHAVNTRPNGEHACQQLRRDAYDVVLSIEPARARRRVTVCREIRKAGNDTSVVMVSVRSDVKDKVLALEAGADDSPGQAGGSPRAHRARHAVARRRVGGRAAVLRAGGITLSERERSVLVQEQAVELTQREFALLAYLMHRTKRGRCPARRSSRTCGRALDGLGSNVIDVYVRRPRGKLGAAGLAAPHRQRDRLPVRAG